MTQELKHYAENVFMWRRARFIGPEQMQPEDGAIAHLWQEYKTSHKDADMSSWLDGYFKSAHKRHC